MATVPPWCTKGYNELWRSDAYDSIGTLRGIFENPRIHTGKGYRNASQASRGYVQCGFLRKREQFRCKSSAPAILCKSCHLVYYCSKACESQHYLEHADYCFPIEMMRERHINSGKTDASSMRGYATAINLSGKRSFEALLLKAEYIHNADDEWDTAIALYNDLLARNPSSGGTSAGWRQVWSGLSRCFYEIKQYDKAIHAGLAALEMNRYFPQAHKYVALAQKAIGDMRGARATMTKAVLYEAPWDDVNFDLNKALLVELL